MLYALTGIGLVRVEADDPLGEFKSLVVTSFS